MKAIVLECHSFLSKIITEREPIQSLTENLIMNVSGASRSLRNSKIDYEQGGYNGITLSFYSEPPQFELSLDEFEEFALARLKVRFFVSSFCASV